MLQAAAFLTVARPVVMLAALGVVIAAVVQRSVPVLVFGMQAGIFGFFFSVLCWLLAKSARCPLCGTPVMGGAACVRHRMARRLFGSHSLRVAAYIGFRGQFTCPYCNESTAMLSSERVREYSANRRRRRSNRSIPEKDVWEEL